VKEKHQLSDSYSPGLGKHIPRLSSPSAVDFAHKQKVNLLVFEAGRVNSPFEDSKYQVLFDLVDTKRLDGLVVFTEGMDQFVGQQAMNTFLKSRYQGDLLLSSIGAMEGIPVLGPI
jgi:hypothetical protein